MHFFTSITANYLPKARVLAKSLQEHCDDVYFTLVVSDDLPVDFTIENEPFDQVWYIEDLGIPVDNLQMWIFTHTVVELCTAVKGAAILKLLEESKYNKIVYLDPDIAVFDKLSELSGTLDKYDIVLTPHLTVPEEEKNAIEDNEICALKHGIYNLGFIALKRSCNAMKFAEWWTDRLTNYCYNDIPNGLFTDQRWCDFVPSFFDGVYIEKSCAYNVSTWNLSHRIITEENGHYYVNDKSLQFYHFSGFDSGAQEMMLQVYGKTKETRDLREWYIKQQVVNGQEQLGAVQCKYSVFSDGSEITSGHREVLKKRIDVINHFSDINPFVVDRSERCYKIWYDSNVITEADSEDEKDKIIAELTAKLNRVKRYLAPVLWVRRIFKHMFSRA